MKTAKSYELPSFLINSKSYLKPRYLLGYMYDVANLQSFKVEDTAFKNKYAWVLYSWDVEIIDPIKAFDQIEVTTYAIKMNKFYAYRNFIIEKDGKLVAKAYCVLLLIDIERQRPVKVPKDIEEAYGNEESVYNGRDVDFEEDFEQSHKLQIRRADIDVNLHVNNAAYMDLIEDLTKFSDQDIEYFKVIYKNEIRDRDFVIGEVKNKEKQSDFRLRSEDGKVYTYGKMIKRNV